MAKAAEVGVDEPFNLPVESVLEVCCRRALDAVLNENHRPFDSGCDWCADMRLFQQGRLEEQRARRRAERLGRWGGLPSWRPEEVQRETLAKGDNGESFSSSECDRGTNRADPAPSPLADLSPNYARFVAYPSHFGKPSF